MYEPISICQNIYFVSGASPKRNLSFALFFALQVNALRYRYEILLKDALYHEKICKSNITLKFVHTKKLAMKLLNRVYLKSVNVYENKSWIYDSN